MIWQKIKWWSVDILVGGFIFSGLFWARHQVLRKVRADERAAAMQERIAVALERRHDR